MKYCIYTFFIISFCSFSLRPLLGGYEVEAIMIEKYTNTPIINKLFLINSDSVYSDETGKISYTMPFASGQLRSKVGLRKSIFVDKMFNPKYIVIKYSGQNIFLKNKWIRYGANQAYDEKPKPYKVKLKWY